MDKVAKQILNSLKCPICGSQIDLFEWAKPVSKKGNNFGCVAEPSHYGLFFVHWELPYRIEKEDVMIYNGSHLYDIQQEHYIANTSGRVKITRTRIYIRDIDEEFRIIDNGVFKTFAYNKLLFDFAHTTRDKVINRVKTILVFQ